MLSEQGQAEKPKHGEIRMWTEHDAESKCYRVKATLYFDPRRVTYRPETGHD